MSSITFDKLAYVDTLTKGGVPEGQARAQADALDVALRDTVATKGDIARLEANVARGLAEQKADILKWMIGAFIAFAAIIIAAIKLL